MSLPADQIRRSEYFDCEDVILESNTNEGGSQRYNMTKVEQIKYQLISASGNPTAIIYGKYSRSQKSRINKKIFAANKLVEQIGYLYNKDNKPYFEMMGNEFSANGCRAAAFSLLKFKSGTINFKTTGTTKTIKAQVKKDKKSIISIPYSFTPKKIKKSDRGFLIKMFGSYLLTLEEKYSMISAKNIIKNNFNKANAVGIMFIRKLSNNKIKMTPVFFVKETNTLIKETACGSGSTAAAIYYAYKEKRALNKLEILQPSGKPIFVSLKYRNEKIDQIKIWGPTTFLGTYKTNSCLNEIK